MTLQQLEYILALNRHRHFAKAAEACGVNQSTLSISIQKLEDELDARIFNRDSHPVTLTSIGEEIITQAKIAVFNAKLIKEIALSRKTSAKGHLRIGLIGSVSVYLLPRLIRFMKHEYPNVSIIPEEASSESLVHKLLLTEIDCAILTSNIKNDNILEIPLYKEELVAFVSPDDELFKQDELHKEDLPMDRMWRLSGKHSPANTLLGTENHDKHYNMAGTIETLVRIVMLNGGYTIIPKTHIELMRKQYLTSIRPILPTTYRPISLYIRKDYTSERLLNILIQAIKQSVPNDLISSPLLNNPIKL